MENKPRNPMQDFPNSQEAPAPMQDERVLITGGAGFIGSRLAKALMASGAAVLAYDNLNAQVHGETPVLDQEIPLVRGDVRDRTALEATVAEYQPTVVVHLAAETGTGQSGDEPSRYAEVNVVGTARLIEAMRRAKTAPRRVVLAATRAVYGEGAYAGPGGNIIVPMPRRASDMAAGRFGLFDAEGNLLTPMPTQESLPPAPASVYGSTKLMQEYLLQQTEGSWNLAILRLQNVYGPGQSLRNPYTGVLSIFCQQALSGKILNIYEDGEIHRDFVFVDDVVAAFVAAIRTETAAGHTINIGTGQRTSIRDAAVAILSALGLARDRLRVTGDFRVGDVRHAVADITCAKQVLDWHSTVPFDKGISALASWARNEYLQGVASEVS
jgi:dTDP-L-rhamnose 4-epimerase